MSDDTKKTTILFMPEPTYEEGEPHFTIPAGFFWGAWNTGETIKFNSQGEEIMSENNEQPIIWLEPDGKELILEVFSQSYDIEKTMESKPKAFLGEEILPLIIGPALQAMEIPLIFKELPFQIGVRIREATHEEKMERLECEIKESKMEQIMSRGSRKPQSEDPASNETSITFNINYANGRQIEGFFEKDSALEFIERLKEFQPTVTQEVEENGN